MALNPDGPMVGQENMPPSDASKVKIGTRHLSCRLLDATIAPARYMTILRREKISIGTHGDFRRLHVKSARLKSLDGINAR